MKQQDNQQEDREQGGKGSHAVGFGRIMVDHRHAKVVDRARQLPDLRLAQELRLVHEGAAERGAAVPKRVVMADDTLAADTAYRLACEGTKNAATAYLDMAREMGAEVTLDGGEKLVAELGPDGRPTSLSVVAERTQLEQYRAIRWRERAGRFWPPELVTVSAAEFSAEQIAALKAEPLLSVQIQE